MRLNLLSTAILTFYLMNAEAQRIHRPEFNSSVFIGISKESGKGSYSIRNQTYELSVTGQKNEKYHGVLMPTSVTGDFILSGSIEPTTNGNAGLAVLDQNGALKISGLRNADGTVIYFDHSNQKVTRGTKSNFELMYLERNGDRFILKASSKHEPLQTIGEWFLQDFPKTCSVGLWLEASVDDAKSTFTNVRLDQPVPYDYNGEESGHLGSRLEVMDISTGERTIIFESDERFEAPNFMPDGKNLLFNWNGLLYTIGINGGEPKLFSTGFANRNNNDHGISFDGKLLALSHHRDGLPGGGSTVYVMPLTGGEPKLVTELTPSYWHGWNPNNREVVYVAQRNGNTRYQLYKKDINGGPEIALTNFDKGHVDGPEYSPDGAYIYYNGSQTGTMQLWRMDPQGNNPEQLTFDELNNWFPHVSPNGKWIAYLSFPPDIHPDDHPAYKKVQLRLMPAHGGSPRVLTNLYGGQGTINVPSWSPDNRYIAFVSNSSKKK